ncbi:Gfo/Idh/MocA family protein [Ferruginibacter yonginensis]|uniref:Gfo/Idh/MocA family protein n=1 Tax=Ferruginibacter yonginensis TaxID=1310416 RepID=A0ABV8QM96_9BACT
MSIKFAIIGCGRIGSRHAIQIAAQAKLIAVCDIDLQKAQNLAQQYGAKAYDNIHTLLTNEPTIEVVSICTPNGLHAPQTIAALQSKKHVLCEKPLSISVATAAQMLQTAAANHQKLFVVKQNRYNPPIIFLKKLIDDGALGKINSFQINCFWNRPTAYYQDWKGTKELDGGTLYTQFSHFIDLMYWLLGDVATVQTTVANFLHPTIAFEDTGMVIFNMQNGAIGTLNYTVNSFDTNMEGSITVFGEKGTVKVGGQYLNELEYCNVQNVEVPTLPKGNPSNSYGFYQGSMSNHDKVYENIIAALQNNEHEVASGEDGLRTVVIIEKIYAASQH